MQETVKCSYCKKRIFDLEWQKCTAVKIKCPNCGRRAFDISKLPKEEIEVTIKCPQCGKFVTIPCNEESELKAKVVSSAKPERR